MFKRNLYLLSLSLILEAVVLPAALAPQATIATKILNEQPCSYKDYSATCGQVQVPENHVVPKSPTITLPYQLVRGNIAEERSRPVVLALGGGPGMSNMGFAPSKEILEISDVLLVGFRGADGSVDLSCPEVDTAFSKEKRLFNPQSQANIRDAFSLCLTRLAENNINISLFNPQQTVEDMEAVRNILGIQKLNILSGSFGTRLAQYYAMQHPEALDKMILVAANPPGRTLWEPEQVDRIMHNYGIKNAAAVLAAIPESWMGIDLDPARIGISTFAMLYSTDSAGMAISAFKDAEEGDYSGLSMLSLSHDMMVTGMMNWGHLMIMAGSVDYDSKRNYNAELTANKSSFGSPMARFLWTMMTPDTVRLLPSNFTALKPITTPTLVVGGELDISTPTVFAEQELMPYLENGYLLQVGNAGHYDLWKKPVREILAAYLTNGSTPANFALTKPNYDPGFFTMSRVAKLAPVAMILILMVLLYVIRLIVVKVRK